MGDLHQLPTALDLCGVCVRQTCIPECDEESLSDRNILRLSLRRMIADAHDPWCGVELLEGD